MLPKPQSRLELLYEKIALGVSDNLPIPKSRLEVLVKALITNEIDNLPTPLSRSEMLLHAILKNEECNLNAQSRVELFLKAILNVDTENLPTPLSRVEVFLDYIARNGCLEKFEYYPFSFTSNLTVNNTVKAKMKIKSIKGKTLVSRYSIKQLSKSVAMYDWIRQIPYTVKEGVTYTVVCNIKTPALNEIHLKYSNTNTYITNLKSSAVFSFVATQASYLVLVSLEEGVHEVSDFMLLEGDHTQNLPSYFEGMLSVGQDNKNKIEILSGNKDSAVSNKKEILLSEPLKGVNGNICDEIAYLDETDINASQGKGLYHVKRCDERPYQAGDESNSNVVTDMTNTVYQLDSPIVTKIDDIEIYSHEEQTNLFVSGGAIPVMATVEVGTKIGTIVSQLRKEVKEIDKQQSQHMKYVLNGDMRAIAEDLYPQDFVETE